MVALSNSATGLEGGLALGLVVLLSSGLSQLEEPTARHCAVLVGVAGVAAGDGAVADPGVGGLVGLGVDRFWRVEHACCV